MKRFISIANWRLPGSRWLEEVGGGRLSLMHTAFLVGVVLHFTLEARGHQNKTEGSLLTLHSQLKLPQFFGRLLVADIVFTIEIIKLPLLEQRNLTAHLLETKRKCALHMLPTRAYSPFGVGGRGGLRVPPESPDATAEDAIVSDIWQESHQG
eukprot:1161169-Pelagomonas_calceolata.AAC.4